MASYQLSERVNFQVVLWAMASAVYWSVVGLAAAVRWAVAMLVAGLVALAPHAGVLAKGLALTAVLVALAAVVAMIPPTFWLGLLITGALAYTGYPRSRKTQTKVSELPADRKVDQIYVNLAIIYNEAS